MKVRVSFDTSELEAAVADVAKHARAMEKAAHEFDQAITRLREVADRGVEATVDG